MSRLDRLDPNVRGTASLAGLLAAVLTLAVGALTAPATASTPPGDAADIDAAERLSRAFAAVADRIAPAVVSIESVQEVRAAPRRQPMVPFFGDPDEEPADPRRFRRGGEGSGFVVREDGYIVTNNHVVAGADLVRVRFNDGRVFEARIIGGDAPSDLAVLKVDAADLSAVPFAATDALRVGQWVVAAGNPFGLGSSITAGIVSATGRGIGINQYEDFIQTDAAINPGNSGGPLLNLRGEVVGVNTAILSRTGGNVGIGFAIPADLAESVVDQLIDQGTVRRGYLGVRMAPLPDAVRADLGLDRPGVAVVEVTGDGPAGDAGILAEDIIVAVDGEPVATPAELGLVIASRRPGQRVLLEVYRDRRVREVPVVLAEFTVERMSGRMTPTPRPTPESSPTPPPTEDEIEAIRGETVRVFGMDLITLTPQLAARAGVVDLSDGLLVARVRPGSAAAAAGLTAGSVITAVDGRAVEDLAAWGSFMAAREWAGRPRITVRVGEDVRTLTLDPR
ncbi:MAG: trypsin-like peptidase domain-containing protein [Planctomycetota bacterium]|jgi:serine protease Do